MRVLDVGIIFAIVTIVPHLDSGGRTVGVVAVYSALAAVHWTCKDTWGVPRLALARGHLDSVTGQHSGGRVFLEKARA